MKKLLKYITILTIILTSFNACMPSLVFALRPISHQNSSFKSDPEMTRRQFGILAAFALLAPKARAEDIAVPSEVSQQINDFMRTDNSAFFVFSAHGRKYDKESGREHFREIEPVLDELFNQAKISGKRLVIITESAPTMPRSLVLYGLLGNRDTINRTFNNADYEQEIMEYAESRSFTKCGERSFYREHVSDITRSLKADTPFYQEFEKLMMRKAEQDDCCEFAVFDELHSVEAYLLDLDISLSMQIIEDLESQQRSAFLQLSRDKAALRIIELKRKIMQYYAQWNLQRDKNILTLAQNLPTATAQDKIVVIRGAAHQETLAELFSSAGIRTFAVSTKGSLEAVRELFQSREDEFEQLEAEYQQAKSQMESSRRHTLFNTALFLGAGIGIFAVKHYAGHISLSEIPEKIKAVLYSAPNPLQDNISNLLEASA